MAERGYFSISVKGLYQDGDKILVILDEDGRWELPGGGVNDDEMDLLAVLERECEEELGVDIEILDKRPLDAWIAETDGRTVRAIVVYRIKPKTFDFKINPEAQEVRMVTKQELNKLNLVPQLNKIKEII